MGSWPGTDCGRGDPFPICPPPVSGMTLAYPVNAHTHYM